MREGKWKTAKGKSGMCQKSCLLPFPLCLASRLWDSFRFGCGLRCGLFRPVSWNNLATDDGFGAEFVADIGSALHPPDDALPNQHVHFEAQLISGNNRAAKARLFDAGEEHELALRANLVEQQHGAGLSHGFDDQHAWHDRVSGEVTLKILLVRAN